MSGKGGSEMIEYTSMEKSKQLETIGFGEKADYCYHRYTETDDEDVCADNLLSAYRSDTLLEWLVAKDWDIQIGKPHDKVLVDAASMKAQSRLFTEADNIPDALADVVFAILAPPPKEVK